MAENRRIIQLLGAMHDGDATGHQALLLDSIFGKLGYDSALCAPTIDDSLKDKVIPFSEFDKTYAPESDIIWMHYNLPSFLTVKFRELLGKKILQFHNFTPAKYFLPYNIELANLLDSSSDDLRSINNSPNAVIADSIFNGSVLKELGFRDVTHLPLIFDQSLYEGKKSTLVENEYSDDSITNILFVGRIAPNKRIEDLIRFFAFYKSCIRNSARLLLVGKYNHDDPYYRMLIRLIGRLGTEDIIFTGGVMQEELCSFYRVSDIFLSFSDHEGFFMPLLEAFRFELPVLAYSAAVVPETAGNGALLFCERNIEEISALVEEILLNEGLRNSLINNGKKRLEFFSIDKSKARIKELLNKL